MQQRQLRLGDILDDYCPRERRVTNHAVVAMVGPDVKQTRCTTCDAEHEYKHARVPRQRRKADTPSALYSQVLAGGPKRVEPVGPARADEPVAFDAEIAEEPEPPIADHDLVASGRDESEAEIDGGEGEDEAIEIEEGPVHRPLIRATLPRPEGQPPPQRPAPEFTIRQPGGRPGRFRHRHGGRGGQQFQGNRSGGSMSGGPHRGGGMSRPGGGRPPVSHVANRHGGRKRSK